jgi:acetyl esterase
MLDEGQLKYVARLRKRETRFGVPFSTRDLNQTRNSVERIQECFARGGPNLALAENIECDLGEELLSCRIYQREPTANSNLPLIVYLHGGGWMINSINTHDYLHRCYAKLTGATVVAPAYAKSPEHPFPVALNQITRLIKKLSKGELMENACRKVVVGGDSAGGNLALTSALALRADGFADLAGVIVNYGVLDDDFETASYKRFGRGDFLLSTEAMKMFFRNYIGSKSSILDPLVTPLKADIRALPPLFISVGEADVLASENVALAQKALEQGVSCDLDFYSGLMHGYIRIPQYVDRANLALMRQVAWFNALNG